jgi:hypothetical protein
MQSDVRNAPPLALLQERLAVTIISEESYMSDVRMPLFAEYWEDIYVRLTFYPHVARRLAFDFGCGSLWSRQYLSRAIRSDGSGHWR